MIVVIDRSLITWRAARVENGQVTAIALAPTEAADPSGRLPPLDGDVFLGRVRRVAPEVKGCFIDLGRGEQALLPFEPKGDKPTEGAAVLVEVTRAARGSKGPRVSRHIHLAGRWPDYPALQAEAARLTAPCAIRIRPPEDRVLAHVLKPGVQAVRVPPALHDPVAAALARLGSDLKPDLCREAGGPFEAEGVEAQLDACIEPRVEFGSGAFLMIEPTAALVAIDVNAGTDQRSWSQINAEAGAEIARQIVLRDLGGHIVVDFIGGRDGPDLGPVVKALGLALNKSGEKARVIGPSALGLVEIERRRRDQGIIGDVRHFADRAFRRAEALTRSRPGRAIQVTCGPAVFDWFAARPDLPAALGRELGRAPVLVPDARLKPSETRVEDRAP